MPEPIILDALPAHAVNDDPATHPLNATTAQAQAMHGWVDTLDSVSVQVASAVGRFLLFEAGQSTISTFGSLDPRFRQAAGESGDPQGFRTGMAAARLVSAHGVDPLVILALRGSGLDRETRLMVGMCGISPAEAHQQARDGTLDIDAARILARLRLHRL